MTVTTPIRRLICSLAFAVAVISGAARAEAHPHVWITAVSELVYAPDGTITGVRHAWTFDDMFSAYAVQGLPSKTPGTFTREELTALAQTNVLAVVVFALIVGVALVLGGERYRNILVLLQELLELVMRVVGWIMYLAPLGVMALLAQLIATQDVAVLGSLGKFVAVVVGTTLLHGLVALPLVLYLVTGITPLRFLHGAREALVTAFATSSSSATLPITLRCAQQNLRVKPEIAGFVLPLGATINMDGTALYEAAAALFIASLVGVELNLVQQLIVLFTAMIAAMGAPGIPSAGMVTMVMVLQSVGLPAEAIAILLPMDRLLDTLRTTVNVEGDMVGSLVVQRLVGVTDSTSADH